MRDAVRIVRRRLRRYLEDAGGAQPRAQSRVRAAPAPRAREETGALGAAQALALFEDQARSRALDEAARALKTQRRGYYTISSAGHELNAVLGAQLEPTDPCLVHYRSGAFMLARARRAGERVLDTLREILLSICAAAADPVAGGRHKVWGSGPLWVLPGTSTIASHLPRALGMAFALGRARRLGRPTPIPHGALVCCSFGDASLNHASALSALNAAGYARRTGNALPLLWVCEDNGLGISVPTPRDWVESRVRAMGALDYVRAEGGLSEGWAACAEAIRRCREGRRPVFLHLRTVRLYGHAGSDIETEYRSLAEIEADEARDPLLASARELIERGWARPAALLARLDRVDAEVHEATERALAVAAPLASRADVVAPLRPGDEARAAEAARHPAPALEARSRLFAGRLPERARAPARRTLGAHLGSALSDEMLRRPEIWVFGEDVGRKGGVYHVTAELQKRFGAGRVFDTLLDETTVLGLALGAGTLGLLPVPEIQYLAYVHNALDQIRGEACSMSFFSADQFRNPMVVRIASFAYQKGFGGHFHNDCSIGALRDIPGIHIAAPARGDDAARMLRGALALARECGRVVLFLEPIALYHEKDLYEAGDEAWLSDYPPPPSALLPGEVGVYEPGARDLLILSYANGLRMSLRAAQHLREAHGIAARVIDLRWLHPLPLDEILPHAKACGRVLVADECRASGGIADAVLAGLLERGFTGPLAAVRSADSYVPLGPAARHVLLQEEQIEAAALELAHRRCGARAHTESDASASARTEVRSR